MNNYTLQPIPYLFFDGKCAEALDFYADLFGGKIVSKMTYGDMPADMPADVPAEMAIPEEAMGQVVNEMLELPGGLMLYGGDTRPGWAHAPMAGVMLALNFPTVEQAQSVFDKLADGGQISMPFATAFWAEGFGMLTDKYGIEWCVNGNPGQRP